MVERATTRGARGPRQLLAKAEEAVTTGPAEDEVARLQSRIAQLKSARKELRAGKSPRKSADKRVQFSTDVAALPEPSEDREVVAVVSEDAKTASSGGDAPSEDGVELKSTRTPSTVSASTSAKSIAAPQRPGPKTAAASQAVSRSRATGTTKNEGVSSIAGKISAGASSTTSAMAGKSTLIFGGTSSTSASSSSSSSKRSAENSQEVIPSSGRRRSGRSAEQDSTAIVSSTAAPVVQADASSAKSQHERRLVSPALKADTRFQSRVDTFLGASSPVSSWWSEDGEDGDEENLDAEKRETPLSDSDEDDEALRRRIYGATGSGDEDEQMFDVDEPYAEPERLLPREDSPHITKKEQVTEDLSQEMYVVKPPSGVPDDNKAFCSMDASSSLETKKSSSSCPRTTSTFTSCATKAKAGEDSTRVMALPERDYVGEIAVRPSEFLEKNNVDETGARRSSNSGIPKAASGKTKSMGNAVGSATNAASTAPASEQLVLPSTPSSSSSSSSKNQNIHIYEDGPATTPTRQQQNKKGKDQQSSSSSSASSLSILPPKTVLHKHSPRTRLRPMTAPASAGLCGGRHAVSTFVHDSAAARRYEREEDLQQAIFLYESALSAIQPLESAPEETLGALGKACLEKSAECRARVTELQVKLKILERGGDATTNSAPAAADSGAAPAVVTTPSSSSSSGPFTTAAEDAGSSAYLVAGNMIADAQRAKSSEQTGRAPPPPLITSPAPVTSSSASMTAYTEQEQSSTVILGGATATRPGSGGRRPPNSRDTQMVPLNYVPNKRPATAGGAVVERITLEEAKRRGVKLPSTTAKGVKCPLDVRIRSVKS
ncbi:unnamed protein product [Amoebophrya sp. A25]|nr:unnamed protein product [Amoebophrya sp. A25]|eukprot:GSA25T00011597001.1